VSLTDDIVEALRAGEVVVLPTDTVYGLCGDPNQVDAVRKLHELKERPAELPVALVASNLEAVLEAVPELRGRPAALAAALLPGAFTLVLPNPAGRFPSLTGVHPGTIGVRVPDLPADTRAVLDRVGVVTATSANVHGGPDPATVEEIPEGIRKGVSAILDAGPLPGTPSTVIDLTGTEPRILREGAVSADDALTAIAAATSPGAPKLASE
jgi:L-threonylcarbamoyladenylate synthase